MAAATTNTTGTHHNDPSTITYHHGAPASGRKWETRYDQNNIKNATGIATPENNRLDLIVGGNRHFSRHEIGGHNL
jgi:hypothetical protein